VIVITRKSENKQTVLLIIWVLKTPQNNIPLLQSNQPMTPLNSTRLPLANTAKSETIPHHPSCHTQSRALESPLRLCHSAWALPFHRRVLIALCNLLPLRQSKPSRMQSKTSRSFSADPLKFCPFRTIASTAYWRPSKSLSSCLSIQAIPLLRTRSVSIATSTSSSKQYPFSWWRPQPPIWMKSTGTLKPKDVVYSQPLAYLVNL